MVFWLVQVCQPGSTDSTYSESKERPETEAALEDLLLAKCGKGVAIAPDSGLELHGDSYSAYGGSYTTLEMLVTRVTMMRFANSATAGF